jgi:phosphoribosylaminoimidazole (AIR) synthetase
MGIGMVIVANPASAGRVREHLDARGEAHYDIGRIVEGPKSVSIISASLPVES